MPIMSVENFNFEATQLDLHDFLDNSRLRSKSANLLKRSIIKRFNPKMTKMLEKSCNFLYFTVGSGDHGCLFFAKIQTSGDNSKIQISGESLKHLKVFRDIWITK